jgi:hypothetical protein
LDGYPKSRRPAFCCCRQRRGLGGDVVLFQLRETDQKVSSRLAVIQGNFWRIRVPGLAKFSQGGMASISPSGARIIVRCRIFFNSRILPGHKSWRINSAVSGVNPGSFLLLVEPLEHVERQGQNVFPSLPQWRDEKRHDLGIWVTTLPQSYCPLAVSRASIAPSTMW